MAKYVDGFVLVVPDSKVAEYTKMAEEGRNSWMKHGALSYFECKGDDLTTRDSGGGKPLEFTKLANSKPGENVWFSFIVFESKKHRDEVNKKVMDEMNEMYKDAKDFSMPFDMQRFTYGGFEVAVEGVKTSTKKGNRVTVNNQTVISTSSVRRKDPKFPKK